MTKRILSLLTTLVISFGLFGVVPSITASAGGGYANLTIGESITIDVTDMERFDLQNEYGDGVEYSNESMSVFAYGATITYSGGENGRFEILAASEGFLNIKVYKTNGDAEEYPISINAEELIYNELYYEVLSDSTVQITGYAGKKSEITIPDSIDGKNVTSILYIPYGVKIVTIPNSVISIDDNAFYDGDLGGYYVTIKCNKNSYAEKFAKEHNCQYNLLDEQNPTEPGSSQPSKVSKTNTTAVSEKITVKKPAKVTKLKLTAKKKKLSVSWKKIGGVTGYQVKSAANKKYTNNKKISNTAKNKISLKNLKPNKWYYVKVRAYKTVKGKRYYGDWSKTKKVLTYYNLSDNPTYAEKKGCKLLDKIGRNLHNAFKHCKMTWIKTSTNSKLGTEYFAKYGFKNKIGNCYVMAAKFTVLSRLLGYNAVQVSGQIVSNWGTWIPHSWVLIKLSGKTYLFDPDFEYERGTNGYKLRYYWKNGGYIVGDGKHWKYSKYKKMR